MSGQVESARKATTDMLFYMIAALVEDGDEDPKQTVATDLGKMISLSEDQVRFVLAHINDGSHYLKDIEDAISLIESGDKKSIDIAIKLLKAVCEAGESALKRVNYEQHTNIKSDNVDV